MFKKGGVKNMIFTAIKRNSLGSILESYAYGKKQCYLNSGSRSILETKIKTDTKAGKKMPKKFLETAHNLAKKHWIIYTFICSIFFQHQILRVGLFCLIVF